MTRNTCLRCEQLGVTTMLVQVGRAHACPFHEATYIEAVRQSARNVLGIGDVRPHERKGRPNTGGTNR